MNKDLKIDYLRVSFILSRRMENSTALCIIIYKVVATN